MDRGKLAAELRDKAEHVEERINELLEYDEALTPHDLRVLRDTKELLRVLARVAEGMPLERAFGAPGDWGYNTAIGAALAAPQPAAQGQDAPAEPLHITHGPLERRVGAH